METPPLPMPSPTPTPPTKRKARRKPMDRKSELILQVLSGQITATEAAEVLGMSRKTYYQWEKRLLQGIMTAMEPKPPGRPNQEPDLQAEALQKRVKELEQEVETARQDHQIRDLLDAMREVKSKKKRVGPASPGHDDHPQT